MSDTTDNGELRALIEEWKQRAEWYKSDENTFSPTRELEARRCAKELGELIDENAAE